MNDHNAAEPVMLSKAFASAWEKFMQTGATVTGDICSARQILTRTIAELAEEGEHDEAQLAGRALKTLQRQEAEHALGVRNARNALA